MLSLLLIGIGLSTIAADVRVCPSWDVTVVDEKGQPVSGCVVVQEWGYNFGYEQIINSTNLVTDAAGRVKLTERWVAEPEAASKLKKFARRISVQGDTGPVAGVYIGKTGYDLVQINALSDRLAVYTADGIRSKVTLRRAGQSKVRLAGSP